MTWYSKFESEVHMHVSLFIYEYVIIDLLFALLSKLMYNIVKKKPKQFNNAY